MLPHRRDPYLPLTPTFDLQQGATAMDRGAPPRTSEPDDGERVRSTRTSYFDSPDHGSSKYTRDYNIKSPPGRWAALFVGLGLMTFMSLSIGNAREKEHGLAVKPQGREQVVRLYSLQEDELRSYRWGPQEPDATLKTLIDQLDPEDTRIRNWLLRTRPVSGAGVGVGLGSSDPPEPLLQDRSFSPQHGLSSATEGPGVFDHGSFDKYSDLLQEWKTGREVTACQTSHWQDEFAQMQSEMLSGKRPLRVLEYHCSLGARCYGMADRLLGQFSIFLYAILTKRAVSFGWQTMPFDLLFDAHGVDWSMPFGLANPAPHPAYAPISNNITTFVLRNGRSPELYRDTLLDWGEREGPTWLRLESANRGSVIRAWRIPKARFAVERIGLTRDTAYSCLADFLLRPKADALQLIHAYSSVFALPSLFVIGLQVRAGDRAMEGPSREQAPLRLDDYRTWFHCAEQVEQTYALPNQRVLYFLISDSAELKEQAVRALPGKVVISGITPTWDGIGNKTLAQKLDGEHGVLSEMWMLQHTDYNVLTSFSGFGKLPVWFRGRQRRTIRIPPLRKPQIIPDCSSDSSLESFTEMAQGWSQG